MFSSPQAEPAKNTETTQRSRSPPGIDPTSLLTKGFLRNRGESSHVLHPSSQGARLPGGKEPDSWKKRFPLVFRAQSAFPGRISSPPHPNKLSCFKARSHRPPGQAHTRHCQGTSRAISSYISFLKSTPRSNRVCCSVRDKNHRATRREPC